MNNEEAINFILGSQSRQDATLERIDAQLERIAEHHAQLQEQLSFLAQRIDAVFFRQADETDALKAAQLGLVALMGTLAETRKAGDEKMNALIDAQMRTEASLDLFIQEVRRLRKEHNGGEQSN